MKLYEWVLIQYDWCPYKKENWTQKDHVKTQGEDGQLQGKEQGLSRNQCC